MSEIYKRMMKGFEKLDDSDYKYGDNFSRWRIAPSVDIEDSKFISGLDSLMFLVGYKRISGFKDPVMYSNMDPAPTPTPFTVFQMYPYTSSDENYFLTKKQKNFLSWKERTF
jgi:hypothetical protein